MKRSTLALNARRVALIEQIADERDAVSSALHFAQQRFDVVRNRLNQFHMFTRHPAFIAAAVVGVWFIGWRRSASIAKSVALGWSAWRRITEQ
jgi:type VI protein secretion system component VasF